MDIPNIFQLLSYVAGIIGVGYGILMRRKLVRFQIKTERAKTSYYKSKRKSEEVRKNKDLVVAIKTFWDLITGNKTNSTERL